MKSVFGMFYDKLPNSINFIINEKYMAWLEKAYFIETLGIRISYLKKQINDQCLNLQKQKQLKKLKKQFLTYWDTSYEWGNEVDKIRKRKFFKKKRFNK